LGKVRILFGRRLAVPGKDLNSPFGEITSEEQQYLLGDIAQSPYVDTIPQGEDPWNKFTRFGRSGAAQQQYNHPGDYYENQIAN